MCRCCVCRAKNSEPPALNRDASPSDMIIPLLYIVCKEKTVYNADDVFRVHNTLVNKMLGDTSSVSSCVRSVVWTNWFVCKCVLIRD